MHNMSTAFHITQGGVMKKSPLSSDASELQMLRLRELNAVLGQSSSTTYRAISDRLLPRPIELGPNRKGWTRYEAEAMNRAKIAGKSPDEIRALVAALESARHALATKSSSEIRAFVFHLLHDISVAA